MVSELIRKKVAEGDAWYTESQRLSQLGSPGSRWALEWRWKLFGYILDQWLMGKNRENRLPSPLHVLDAGCGDGINIEVLHNLFSRRNISVEIAGCDYNDIRLNRASQDCSHRILEVDLRAMPFPHESFDVVLCSHVLEHIHDDVIAMSELSRIIKRSGLVLIAVPNEGCLLARFRNHVVQPSIRQTTDHCQFYTAKSLIDRLAQAGLVPIGSVEHEGIFLPHLGLYSRLRETRLGRVLIPQATRILPSQAAGLVAGFRVSSIHGA
ncbi:MAG: hypothetical protein NPIRA05_08790 [Nitrospirales bacterium]|nr:MAG: hypothetical protein NPIRA05_08790 [Nitrospirales bacterium]